MHIASGLHHASEDAGPRRRGAALFFVVLLLGQHGHAQLTAEPNVGVAWDASNGNGEAGGPRAASFADDRIHDAAFGVPPSSVVQLAETRGGGAGPSERRLLYRSATLQSNSTDLILVPDIGSDIQCTALACLEIGSDLLHAGLGFNTVELDIRPNLFGYPANEEARLRFVKGPAPNVTMGACTNETTGAFEGLIKGEWAALRGAPTATSGAEMFAEAHFTFLMGGQYVICYSDDGSFAYPDHVDLVPPVLTVSGIYDTRVQCSQDMTCLTKRLYYCYLTRNSYNNADGLFSAGTSCVVDYQHDHAGFEGPIGYGTWSAEFLAEYDADGLVSAVVEQPCSNASNPNVDPAGFLCWKGVEPSNPAADPYTDCTGSPFLRPNASEVTRKGTIDLPVNRPDLHGDTYKAKTVAACYCVDFNSCYAPVDYLQQIGILHYFAAKICQPGEKATACQNDYVGVTPQHRFAIRVECPTGACTAGLDNRLKIIARRPENDLPSWTRDSAGRMANGCGMVSWAAHGRNINGTMVLPYDLPNFDVENEPGEHPFATVGRQDYKLWNYRADLDASKAGFLFKTGDGDVELRNFFKSETFDMCYCDSGCHSSFNWFKVGHFRLASFRLVSGLSGTSRFQKEFTIEYVNQRGTLAFALPYADRGAYGLEPGGMIKLVSDNDATMTDEKCRLAPYDAAYSSSLTSEAIASSQFSGRISSLDDKRLVFNGGNEERYISVTKAGMMAVCYCSEVESGVCAHQWVYAMRFIIRGPQPGQFWSFSTHVVFRFAIEGVGLTADDKFRIIPADSECTDQENNPSGHYYLTGMKTQCPHPCTQVDGALDLLNGDVDVQLLSSETFDCDLQNEGCRNNDIISVSAGADATQLEFSRPPYFDVNDMISLGDNIACHPRDVGPSGNCNAEKEAAIKGIVRFADEEQHVLASKHYIAGHRLTATGHPNVYTIPVGWQSNAPKIKVSDVNGKRGRWTRHSRVSTKKELLGTIHAHGMKVCWKFGGPLGKYVAQAGTLTLIHPNPLANTFVSMLTSQRNIIAPVVITFTTAPETTEAGSKYSMITGATQLKFFFIDSFLGLSPYFADGTVLQDNMMEDEFSDAKQYVCGKLFLEVWSNDTELGFPMPRGCYYRLYGVTKEVVMVFEPRSGLRPGTRYALVINGAALREAAQHGEYLHIITTHDVDKKPYEAVERGVAPLTTEPQLTAFGDEGVRFNSVDGLKLVDEAVESDLMQLTGSSVLQMVISGDPLAGGIPERSILRVFLWPILTWEVNALCTAVCVPLNPAGPCGPVQYCRGDSTVPGFPKNHLIMQLPIGMATATEVITHKINVTTFGLPAKGFFPMHVTAQASLPDHTKPHYTTSSGKMLWKQPDAGTTVAKIVDVFGDGDQRPFRGMDFNVIYARITLAATMFSVFQAGDAYMTMILPLGYTCVRMIDIDGSSAWRAEETLSVFGDRIPQGRGSPDSGVGRRGWSVEGNNCTFTMRQSGVLYAGSSLYIRTTVHNPDAALKREDSANEWQLVLTGRGYSIVEDVTFDPVVFSSPPGDFKPNVAVLGRMPSAFVLPSNFAIGAQGKHAVQVFFQTEQDTGVFAAVQLIAPDGYLFDNPCLVSNLDTQYYAARTGHVTRRLPCVHCPCESTTTPEIRMLISLTGSLVAGEHYGFQTEVMNPMNFSTSGTGWKIFTMSEPRYQIDGWVGNVEPLKIASILGSATNLTYQSAPLCDTVLNEPGIALRFGVFFRSRLTPYNMTRIRTDVDIYPLRVPDTANEPLTLVIVAPYGFVWDFEDEEFLYQAPGENSTHIFPEATADLPGGVPERDGNVLLWRRPSAWDRSARYGFRAKVIVPDESPISSANAFFAMFSRTSGPSSRCFAAAVYHVNPVAALVNAKVEYVNNIAGAPNNISFTLEIVTPIDSSGILRIVGPDGYDFGTFCSVEQAPGERGAPYVVEATKLLVRELPRNLICNVETYPGSRVEVVLIVPPGSMIPAARYQWQMAVVNPTIAMDNKVESGSDCGYKYCWLFYTTAVNGLPLDAMTSCPAFGVNRRMPAAMFPELTPAQWTATGRDYRPYYLNPMVFAFQISDAAFNPRALTIRGPVGTIFRETCLEDIEVHPSRVFGSGMEFPAMYTPWVSDVVIRSCRGEGPDARLWLDPGVGWGLQPGALYAFRMNIFHNPVKQPRVNTWTVDFNGESSDPFEGYRLWTFTRASLHYVNTALTNHEMGARTYASPVTITFRPENTVRGVGMKIKVTAPIGFKFENELGLCEILLQPIQADIMDFPNETIDVAPPPNYVGPKSLIWGVSDTTCIIDEEHSPNHLEATVAPSAPTRELTGGRDYQVTFMIYTPMAPVIFTEAENVWKLETVQSPQEGGGIPLFRDEIILDGFPLNARAAVFTWQNGDDFPPNAEVTRGGTVVPNLYFEMRMAYDLILDDVVTIEAPLGYKFVTNETKNDGKCIFRYLRFPFNGTELRNSTAMCNGTNFSWVVNETIPVPQSYPERGLIKFRTELQMPADTPHVMQNNFVLRHERVGTTISSELVPCWQIVPQLSGVSVDLVGDFRRAGAYSAILITFVPRTDADMLQLAAREPKFWDFTESYASSLGHEVMSTENKGCNCGGEDAYSKFTCTKPCIVTVRANLYAGVETQLRLEHVKLGTPGGLTEWDLITMLSNGEIKDETFALEGFRLPGSFDLVNFNDPARPSLHPPRLISMYELRKQNYPVASRLPIRMGESAVIKFVFRFSMRVKWNTIIALYSPGYGFQAENYLRPGHPDWNMFGFKIKVAGSANEDPNGAVATTIVNIAGPQLLARIERDLNANTWYEMQASVVTPQVPQPEDAKWRLEILDASMLPVATNDMLTEGFVLADQVTFRLAVGRAPPAAELAVDLVLEPKSWAPTRATIIAPLGFNFTADCLVSPGDAREVLSCSRMAQSFAGRAQAKMQFKKSGLAGPPQNVRIRITTPSRNSLDRSFFIRLDDEITGTELAWGEDSSGIKVSRMNANVYYLAIPGLIPVVVDTSDAPLWKNSDNWMVFKFEMPESIYNGGKIVVLTPAGFTIRCSMGAVGIDGFRQLSLRGRPTCDSFAEGGFEIILDDNEHTFLGYQTFAVKYVFYRAPDVIVEDFFSLMVYAANPERVVDGVLDARGPRVEHDARFNSLPLAWSNSRANQRSTITLGFEVLQDPVDPPPLAEIAITVPDFFVHQVRSTGHVELSSEACLYLADGFCEQAAGWGILPSSAPTPAPSPDRRDGDPVPTASPTFAGGAGTAEPTDMPTPSPTTPVPTDSWINPGYWLLHSDSKRLNIILDPRKSRTLKRSRLRVFFPVLLPARMPNNNVFFLTICGPSDTNVSCTGPDDPRAIVSFPYPGFEEGDVSPHSFFGARASARRAGEGSAGAVAVAVCSLALLRRLGR